MPELLSTSLPVLPPPKVGKVREVYDLGDQVLIVATDRISAFDVVMANGIPQKGEILNRMSAFWFGHLADVCPSHFMTIASSDIDACLGAAHPELHGRSLLAQKADPLPVECVARGYLTGSLYKQYVQSGGALLGLSLPSGLRDGDRLPEPIFSPATKATQGHDENISFEQVRNILGGEVAEKVRCWTLELYARAADHAEKAGIILADTKFEFGRTDEGIILIDEALTPDSSRFWKRETWKPGGPQPSYDKQFVRDFLETLDWNKQPPGPKLPPDVVAGTRARYVEAYERIVGEPFVATNN
ncbi:MAG TPA: phosphoribosylaminoimidazolesuccinocarboxamide synthase [Fimbriimonadaceae bacterium]|nr:phosphoribosylaminoimidazolesuccinocarboxamide synthase [Fimbriimonadaceae bacterium]